jgi:hypothetical protein
MKVWHPLRLPPLPNASSDPGPVLVARHYDRRTVGRGDTVAASPVSFRSVLFRHGAPAQTTHISTSW